MWPAYVAENFGLRAAQGRGALLAIGPEEHHTRLDLIEWLEPRWEPPQAERPIEERAPRIIALRTQNLRAAYRELSERGIAFMRPPRDPDPATGIESVVCCRDPDGNLIELIEYMPGVLGSRIAHLRGGTRPGRGPGCTAPAFSRPDRALDARSACPPSNTSTIWPRGIEVEQGLAGLDRVAELELALCRRRP